MTLSVAPVRVARPVALHPGRRSSSDACAGTILWAAPRARPVASTSISTPRGTGFSRAAAERNSAFMSTRCSRSAVMSTLDQSVFESAHDFGQGGEAAPATFHEHRMRMVRPVL